MTDRRFVQLIGRGLSALLGLVVCAWIWPIDQTVIRVKERRRGNR